MGYAIFDRVKQTTTSTGTGDILIDGAITGYRNFRDVLAVGDYTSYCITDGQDWEVGVGNIVSYGTAPACTLNRHKIIASSNSNNVVNFSAGTKDVFITNPARRMVGRGLAFAFAAGRYNS